MNRTIVFASYRELFICRGPAFIAPLFRPVLARAFLRCFAPRTAKLRQNSFSYGKNAAFFSQIILSVLPFPLRYAGVVF